MPSATELIAAIGQTDRLVGVTLNDNYPPQVRELPKVGDQAIDFEQLLALKPDLVVLDSNFNQNRQAIERLGLQVLELRCERLDDVPRAMRELGRSLDSLEQAEAAASRFEKELAKFLAVRPPKSVFVEIWSEPLMSVGGLTLVNDLLSVLEVKNVYGDINGYFQVDPEDVVSRAPEVILLPSAAGQNVSSKAWQLLRKTGQSPEVIVIDADLLVRPGPRLLDGLALLSQRLSTENTD